MSTTAQLLIRTFVREYTLTFPQEWARFQEAMKIKLGESKDAFGEVADSELIERKLFEMPETLFTILTMKLSEEDMKWFRTKEGSRWFAKQYPQFRTSSRT